MIVITTRLIHVELVHENSLLLFLIKKHVPIEIDGLPVIDNPYSKITIFLYRINGIWLRVTLYVVITKNRPIHILVGLLDIIGPKIYERF